MTGVTTYATTLSDAFAAQVEELTPTMKLKRRPIAHKYADQIKALYTTKEKR